MLLISTLTFQPQLTGEIRSYHQVGDKIKGEFARLYPDGSVTKTLAYGDTKQGLQYKTYQMDPLGNVKSVDFPGQQQLDQGQPQGQAQISGQAAQPLQTGSAAVPPGVNWFMQQPQVPQAAAAVPGSTNPFTAPDPFQQPGFQDPFFTNPLTNLFNF